MRNGNKYKTSRRHFDGWTFDFARALTTGALYVGFIVLGLSKSFLYGGGLVGTFPLLLAFFGGPWPAAWITLKLLPSHKRRMTPRLACGIYAGYFVCWMFLALVSVLLPKWPDSDPRTRFMARYDFELTVIPFCIFFIAGPFVFSRWRSRLPA
jgi:hypothetical protein